MRSGSRTSVGTTVGATGALWAGLAVFGSVAADAGEIRGPAFGANRYAATIANETDETDCDDYVGLLAAGEKITATLTLPKASALVPTLEIVGPDGRVRIADVRVARRGRLLTIRGFPADTTGEWAVRVRGHDGSQGAYTIAFRAPAEVRSVRAKAAAAAGSEASVRFEAVEGTTADIAVAWTKRAGPARIVSLLDPSGGDALASAGGPDVFVVRGRRAAAKGLVLGDGHGAYELRLAGSDGAPVSAVVSVRLRSPARPGGKRIVALADEPHLAAIGEPLEGVAGRPVPIFGSRLAPGVRFLFGESESTSVVWFPGGTEAHVVVPPGEPGSTVSLAAVAADGQACVRPGAFRYVPAPAFSAVTRLDGSPISGWSRFGGIEVRITGDAFRAGQVVRFPGPVDAAPTLVSATELTVHIPVTPAATDHLYVIDEWGQSARSPDPFEMKTPPSFAVAPYAPSIASVGADTVVVLRGAGFETTDVLFVDGVETPSLFVDPGTRRFTFAGRAAGRYAVQIRDRIGLVADGPPFDVKGPPVIDSVAVTTAPSLGTNGVPLVGGNTIVVTGSGFESSDVVTLGGTQVERSSGDDTSFAFVAPAGPPGAADLRVVDRAGHTVTSVAAIHYAGFVDTTADRVPPGDEVDDFGAMRGATGDVDSGGFDDLVIGWPNFGFPSLQPSRTRLLLNDGAGLLEDRTDANFPAAFSDSTGTDDWNVAALALGDLDGDQDLDLLAAGWSAAPADSSGVRLFANDGAGGFQLAEEDSPSPSGHGVIVAYVPTYGLQTVATARAPDRAPTAFAIGDIDGDDAPDVVVGHFGVETETVYIDPARVDMSRTPPHVSASDWRDHRIRELRIHAGTRIYRNGLADGSGLIDATDATLPTIGADATAPALVARDVALADIDDDGDLDLVLAWISPRGMSYRGLTIELSDPRIATLVLINDGGRFSDETATWMPAGGGDDAGDDWHQADRILLTDLDGDDDPDLVLLSEFGVDDWRTGTPTNQATALRILRNDGQSFTSVTATAVPPIPAGDDFRGRAAVARDVDGDGRVDLLVATAEALGSGTTTRRSLRFFRQTGDLVFTDASDFLPRVTADTGEAEELLIGDLAGDGTPTLLLLARYAPGVSEGGSKLRAFDWRR